MWTRTGKCLSQGLAEARWLILDGCRQPPRGLVRFVTARSSWQARASFITVPIPQEGQPDLRKPVDITTMNKQSLDYNVGGTWRLEKDIISSCVGVDNTIINETSLADKQVDATYESKDTVLNRIKKGFEEAQEWHDATVADFYGSAFISAG